MKFRLIASQLRAEPLGLCFLVPNVEYQIVHILKVSGQIIEFHVRRNNTLITYVLPKNYAGMVTSTDLNKFNSGQRRYAIVRAVHKCGPDRIHYDHKNYTWDLELVCI